MRIPVVVLLLAALISAPVGAEEHETGVPGTGAPEATAPESKGLLHRVLFYLPNRVLDLQDVVRARLRLGPGMAVGARATQAIDVFIGAYTSTYLGVHGPRGRPEIPWPLGAEANAGIEVSVVGEASRGEYAPNYGRAEVGFGFQLALVGAEIGIAPLELLDFAAGLLLLDPRKDDY